MAEQNEWTPRSWRSKKVAQDVEYPNQEALDKVLKKLTHLPPLVTPTEIVRLRTHLASVSKGESFLLQGGDCAELFDYCSMDPIEHKLSLILLMSLIVIWGGRLPVVRIMRIAGQFAKPRSSSHEVVEGFGKVLSFRGDNINGFDPADRRPDPDRLLQAYFHSSTTLNYIRALLASNFASLQTPRTWSFSHVRSPALQQEFEDVVERLSDALDFMSTIGAPLPETAQGVEIFTSHEGLSLEYEETQTRFLPRPETDEARIARLERGHSINPQRSPSHSRPRGRPAPSSNNLSSSIGSLRSLGKDNAPPPGAYFNTGCHYLWIGDRTRQIDGGHVEYFRGLENPVGVKVGPTMPQGPLPRLVALLDPNREAGKVSLICRYGASKIENFLADHVREVESSGHRVVWVCDPMHGNTKTAENSSLKTRAFEDIIHEITASMRIHAECGSILGGVHLELTGEVNEEGFSVTECTGGSMGLEDKDLSTNYQSHCDPRLNAEQGLDVAFLLADSLKAARRGVVNEQKLLDALKGRVAARSTK